MNIILFDNPVFREKLKPLTLTRPVGNLRVGIHTINKKWEAYLPIANVSYLTEAYLDHKYVADYHETNIYIDASYLPDEAFVGIIEKVSINEGLYYQNSLIAFKTSHKLNFGFEYLPEKCAEYKDNIDVINSLPSLFLNNAHQIKLDFEKIVKGRKSAEITDPFTAVYSPENIFIEEGVSIKAAILNAENGPIYIGKNSIIQEGSLLIGPVAIGENSMVAFGAKIRPNTTLGPVCRVGGEVGNSIFHAFTNKAHDGFLGNSYIGEWCNLGANTNNSNLKNDYKSVKLYDYSVDDLVDSGEIFCGTFMGDYSKAGISTMFNTGTVVGVSVNVYGAGFQEKFIDSFTWGGKTEGYVKYRFEKALEVINDTMSRRNLHLTDEDERILKHISNHNKL